MTARELANNVPPQSPFAEDIAELVSESQRCREILRTLSQKRESEEHTAFTRLPLSTLLETVADSCRRRPGIALEIVTEQSGAAGEPQLVPTPELRHALVNLIDNALQFAARAVRITIGLEAGAGPWCASRTTVRASRPTPSSCSASPTSRPATKPAVSGSACSSRRPCLREPVRRCILTIVRSVPR